VNYEGRFSRWDDATGTINGQTWSSALNDWKYGPNDEVYGVGTNVSGGWKMEVRFKKTFFEDPAVTNRLDNGYVMGFNIGLDDDDKHGIGLNGDQTRTEDLEIQYFWFFRKVCTFYRNGWYAYAQWKTPCCMRYLVFLAVTVPPRRR
jgi:hypothetical protein